MTEVFPGLVIQCIQKPENYLIKVQTLGELRMRGTAKIGYLLYAFTSGLPLE